jgi:hypothetical protein
MSCLMKTGRGMERAERAEMIVMTTAVTRERDQATKTLVEVERATRAPNEPTPLIPEPASTQHTPPAALLGRKSSEGRGVGTAFD